ncbi:MAG: hypothetical protein ACREV4_04695 [Gammaproteobacteria bacterium]
MAVTDEYTFHRARLPGKGYTRRNWGVHRLSRRFGYGGAEGPAGRNFRNLPIVRSRLRGPNPFNKREEQPMLRRIALARLGNREVIRTGDLVGIAEIAGSSKGRVNLS